MVVVSTDVNVINVKVASGILLLELSVTGDVTGRRPIALLAVTPPQFGSIAPHF